MIMFKQIFTMFDELHEMYVHWITYFMIHFYNAYMDLIKYESSGGMDIQS